MKLKLFASTFTFLSLLSPLSYADTGSSRSSVCVDYLMGRVLPLVGKDEHNVIDHILGDIHMSESRSRQYTAEFRPVLPNVLFRQKESGEQILNELAHLENTDSGDQYGPMKFVANFILPAKIAYEFFKQNNLQHSVGDDELDTVFVENSPHLVLQNPNDNSQFAAKVRYVNAPPLRAEELNLAQQNYPYLKTTNLEIRINHLSGPQKGGQRFIQLRLPTDLADKLKSFYAKNGNSRSLIEKIETELINNYPFLNPPEVVYSAMKVLALLLDIDQSAATPEFVTSYEVQRLELNDSLGQSISIKKNLRYYAWNPSIKSASLSRYKVSETPYYEFGLGTVFADIESHFSSESSRDDDISRFFAENHIPWQVYGRNNYLIGRQMRSDSGKSKLDTDLVDQGVFTWVMRGILNLHSLPKKNEVNKTIYVAYPFTAKSGESFLLKLTYRGNQRTNGEKQAALSDISLEDEYGKTIPVNGAFDRSIALALGFSDETLLGLNIEGQVIPFFAKIPESDFERVKTFFKNYYKRDFSPTGKLRTVDILGKIDTLKDAEKAEKRLRRENNASFLLNRFGKWAIGLSFLGLGIFAVKNSGLDEAKVGLFQNEPSSVISGLRHTELGAVTLQIGVDNQRNTVFYLNPKAKSGEERNFAIHSGSENGSPQRVLELNSRYGDSYVFAPTGAQSNDRPAYQLTLPQVEY